MCHFRTKQILTVTFHKNKHTLGQRLQTVVRRAPKSNAASPMVLLAVRLLLGAHTQTASGVHGREACITSVLRSAAAPPGTERKEKDRDPCGILTNPSTMARR